ncbi:response regulator [Novosphingobium sp. JCM 18896]|uniref:response regulator n=1 Tax=Novosphingobium sp. JCM 18896 TaxID=2989731 RepID=UPI0022236C2F|nr:response regulator [Novosphingobium sp. JCM 18896]MCW1430219.1 response regulator [Novosphingobium sp. JCM 18896]
MISPASHDQGRPCAARILIVEDDLLNGFLMEEALQLAGYEVLGPARTVSRAMALLESCVVDAAILDLQIEDETSLAVARRLDDLGIPWAITTGHARSAIPAECDHVRVLTKPFSIKELLDVASDALRHPLAARSDGLRGENGVNQGMRLRASEGLLVSSDRA